MTPDKIGDPNTSWRMMVCGALGRFGVGFLAGLALFAGCSSAPSGYAKGVADANAAIAAGALKLKEYPPLPSPGYYGEYIQLLRDRGIGYEVPSLPPDVSEKVFREEVRGWNQTMEQQINLKIGRAHV
jgi:hypothetical protein